jgi:hypothetical protein
MTPSRNALCLSAAVMAALSLPPAIAAQYRLPTIVAIGTADSLHAAAVTLSRQVGRLGDAARLHHQSAMLRSADDSLGFRCLRAAANLSYVDHDLSNARSSMTQAAAQALARGDLVSAAHAYADAASVASEQRRKDEVWKLGRQAEVLAGSPLLSRGQRASILHRFTHVQKDLAVSTAH